MDDTLTTPSVMDTTNFKEFFLKHDALQNVSSELVVSLQPKYKCNAGCKMCYLRNTWLPDDVLLSKYDTPTLTQDIENQILRLFDCFAIVTTIDDLYTFKQSRPDLYDFYKRHGRRMSSTAMSDIAFIQQYPLIMDEIHFHSIYEISFSDAFLLKNSGKLAIDLVKKLDALHSRSPIIKLKIIMTLDDDTTVDAISHITSWASSVGISVVAYDDITKSRLNTKVDIKTTTIQETTFFPYDTLPMQVLSEVVYLQHTDMYLTMVDGSSEQDPPFYNIQTDGLADMSQFLWRMLEAKLVTYERYINAMGSTCRNKVKDYYQYVVSSVVVNKHFNFIPRLVLPNWTHLYKVIVQQGRFIETPHGLFDPTQASECGIVPLFEVTHAPRQKLHHIPIKCARIKRK